MKLKITNVLIRELNVNQTPVQNKNQKLENDVPHERQQKVNSNLLKEIEEGLCIPEFPWRQWPDGELALQ